MGRPAQRLGVVGNDVPRPVVLAHGAVPVRLSGAWSGPVSARAAALLGAVDAAAARLLDGLLEGPKDGRLEGLAGLVVCHDSAAHLRLFYVLRVLADRGDLPVPVHLLDAPRCDDPVTGRPDPEGPRVRFVERSYHRLAEFCAGLTGRRPTSHDLAEAWRSDEQVGTALARLRDRRAGQHVTGTAALGAYRAAATLPPTDALAAIAGEVGDDDAVPIVVTGSNHPDASVYAEIERHGACVVAEDHDTGDATWIDAADEGGCDGDGDLDALIGALARRHARRPPAASRSRSSVRAEHLLATVRRTGARGVLCLARAHDDAPAWDAPVQDAALRRVGIPFVARTRIGDDPLAVAAAATDELVAAATAREAGR
ncbi:2-hydroxyacyl-CoA dehydratase [Georgenia alba]|uniref:2-hydroxyacyl-CoA dehydratase n=1 Tax=Georgenia alba TaxID=2233858 RepID=A0ABW2QCN8_9MICO